MRSQTWILATTLIAAPAAAQIKTDGVPAAIAGDLRTELVPLEFVQPPDVGAYLAADAARTELGPLRYGALMPCDVDLFTDGVWDELEDGTVVWRFKVYSPGAKTIGLEFDDFWIPEGAQIHLYNDTLETVYGSYTAVNNQPHEEIAFEPFPGDHVIFEYQQPAGTLENPRLSLGTVIYDYRGVYGLEAFDGEQGGSGDGSCFTNVNCPEGDPFDPQKRATFRTFSNGGLCSGALINNTAEDATQYAYTAWHCGQGSNTVFTFNYQTATCSGGSAPQNETVSGATNLVSHQGSDNRLLRINNQIPPSYQAFFAGWRKSTANPTFTMSMNHPSGGPKKIAIDNNGAFKTNVNFQGIGLVNVWRCDWNVGSSAGGASGGPLFDNGGRIIGTLSGGPGGSCPSITYFGRKHVFWNSANVAQYLDPAGTGQTTLEGFDPFGGGAGAFPVVDTVAPALIQTVTPNSPVVVSVAGSGFDEHDSVLLDGVTLTPAEYTQVSDTLITVPLFPPFKIGGYKIDVVEGPITATANVGTSFALTATIDLVDSDPGFLSSTKPSKIYMGGFPFDTVYLTGSLSNVPSSFPGIAELGIGNNGIELVIIGIYTVDALTGYAEADVLLPLPSGTKVYFQAGNLSNIFGTFPLEMSNIEVGTVLF